MEEDTKLIWFTDPVCQNAQLVGNKAANLAKLLSFGYNVPPGFCIPSGTVIDEAQLREALKKLSPSPWAVRSSSTAEDGKELAFAGIFTTVLGSTSAEDILKAIKKVRTSTNNSAVRNYAKSHGIRPNGIKVAVIVQQLIPATAAGVAFSRNPVTSEKTVTIEATWGLGETLVNGSITPDYFEVYANNHIEVACVGTKKHKAVYRNGKVVHTATTKTERTSATLLPDAVHNIAKIIRQIEQSFGVPQDVEWAMDKSMLYIVQSRPITTLNGNYGYTTSSMADNKAQPFTRQQGSLKL